MLRGVLRYALPIVSVHEMGGCGGYYLESFILEIKQIAADLSTRTQAISACFSKERGLVEFRKPNGAPLASLVIQGSVCTPSSAYVFPSALPTSAREVFARRLRKLQVTFTEIVSYPGARSRKVAA